MPETFECHYCGYKMHTRFGWGYGYCSQTCYLWDYLPESFEKEID